MAYSILDFAKSLTFVNVFAFDSLTPLIFAPLPLAFSTSCLVFPGASERLSELDKVAVILNIEVSGAVILLKPLMKRQ